jgi:hypothetical protein
MNTTDDVNLETPAPPWWRVGMVWLVVGGPLTVVVAACVTAVIAIRGADIVIGDGAEGARPRAESSAPAMQARNHAATAAEKR